jgi:phosphoserine phosphatase RsbU/P
MRSTEIIKEEIIKKLGFIPPFFEPAYSSPLMLENLWQQTVSAYLDNPLPDLFKEKLAALIARYCSVPYCLICHSSTLKPLGMSATQVLDLLEQPSASFEELEKRAESIPDKRLEAWPASGSELENAIMDCAIAIYLYVDSERCHAKLRELLNEEDYSYLILFLAYNRTCLTWAEGHPELSYAADKRAQDHLSPLISEEPRLGEFFNNYQHKMQAQAERRLQWLTTENRKLVGEIESKNKDLNTKISILEQEKRLREQFVATMTHDLRTPLTSAKIAAQMLEKNPQQPVDKIVLLSSRISSSMTRADRMIADMLDANQIQAGQNISLNLQPGDLKIFMEEIIKDLAHVHDRPIDFTSFGEFHLKFDHDELRRVMENLINNALKYGDKNRSVTVTLSPAAENKVCIEVHNEGNPIPQDEQKKIFYPFHRSLSAEYNGKKGWGLGLVLVRGIAEAHGGRSGVRSSPEAGTTFWVQLPIS